MAKIQKVPTVHVWFAPFRNKRVCLDNSCEKVTIEKKMKRLD